ncbi:MAG: beta-ketoacyl-ACP synthase III [Pseudomonadota bacterium]
MATVVLSGMGLWKPEEFVTNEELVEAYNAYVELYNAEHADAIARGELEEKPLSSAEFIEKASGIKQRYTYCKDGILDVERMRPRIPARAPDELSHQAEMAISAAERAMRAANKTAADIDMVVVACAYTQRAYPAIAIEVQQALGINGFGFDMLVACSAATFGLHRAHDAVAAGSSKCALVINPELTTPQVNFTDRDGHFIFGDVSTACILEAAETCTSEHAYQVLGTKAVTQFSNNIRSDFGYLSYADDSDPFGDDKLFKQNGRKVFKEVCPMAAQHLKDQVESVGLAVGDVKRWWLHQANINMNELIARRLLGRDPEFIEAPIVLDEYANTASAGSVIAFNLYHEDLQAGDVGVLCSFGAGYSIGSLVLQKH